MLLSRIHRGCVMRPLLRSAIGKDSSPNPTLNSYRICIFWAQPPPTRGSANPCTTVINDESIAQFELAQLVQLHELCKLDAAPRVPSPLHARGLALSDIGRLSSFGLPPLIGKHADVDDALTVMRSQHAAHQRPLERLTAICTALAQQSANSTELSTELRPLAASLERELIQHLELEESAVFPAISRHLSFDEQAAIVRELRARRR